MSIKSSYQKDSDVIAVQTTKDPIEQQILAAGNLSEAQVEAIRGFQRRKGLTFGEAAITLGLVRRDSLFLALSKRYNYPVLNFGSDEARFSRELVVGYQPFSKGAEAFRSIRSGLATGPLSQGKNAFAVIGAALGGRDDQLRGQPGAVVRTDGRADPSRRRQLEEAQARGAFRGRSEERGSGRGAHAFRAEYAAGRHRHRARAFAADRRGDCAPSAGASQLQGVSQPVAKRAAQLWRRDLRYAAGSGKRRRLRRCVAVGAAILVARRHRSKVKDIRTVSQALEGFQCEIAGTVLEQF